MQLITKSARKFARYFNRSLAEWKRNAHRTYRRSMRVSLKRYISESAEEVDVDFSPKRVWMVTSWEIG